MTAQPAPIDTVASGARPIVGLGIARVLPVFSAAASLAYVLLAFPPFWPVWGPFRFYPQAALWAFGDVPGVGPRMMWYGWVFMGLVVGAAAAVLALLVPRATLERLVVRWLWVGVAVPTAMVAWLVYLCRPFFLPA